MARAVFVIPGDLSLPTGGYGYDRRVLAAMPGTGVALDHLAIPGGYPRPDEAILRETARRIGRVPEDALLLVDGLAYGAMPPDLIRGFGRTVIELCHHPLALEPGLDAAEADALRASERAAMALARHVIVTGNETARIVAADFGVPAASITIALPGTDRATRARGSGRPVPHMLAVGSLIPRKGYDVLVDALSAIRHLEWTLDIIGSTNASPETVEALNGQIERLTLGQRIRICGPADAQTLDHAYDTADLFVMSSHFEGYGMVIAEAMARGLPIVSTTGGALADTLPDTAGLKVPPASAADLAAALEAMLASPAKRADLAEGSWRAGQALPGWHTTAATIADAIRRVAT